MIFIIKYTLIRVYTIIIIYLYYYYIILYITNLSYVDCLNIILIKGSLMESSMN